MQDLMFADEPVEKREQLLRDNCDQIVERSCHASSNSTK